VCSTINDAVLTFEIRSTMSREPVAAIVAASASDG
jgi:hypothetical protein